MSTKPLSSLPLEVGSIVLGVLLALGVSEWQQEREKAQLAATALMNVANELEANRALLQQIHSNSTAPIATVNGLTKSSHLFVLSADAGAGVLIRCPSQWSVQSQPRKKA